METEQEQPKVGPGSARGWRWFVSCRYPNLVVTLEPALPKTDTQRAVKGKYAIFQSMGKPLELQGNGKRGTDNWDGTDMNDSQKWGVYGPVQDPGPEPEDGEGYKDDPAADRSKKDQYGKLWMSAEDKNRNRRIINILRETTHYQKTRQIDEVDIHSVLAEITWNPVPKSGALRGKVKRGKATFGKDGLTIEEVPEPQNAKAAVPVAKVPSLKKVAA